MLTLHPQNSFTVVRQIANHLDTDTNYVRAVIRNAYTDEIITTLDLTSRGSQRFSKNWQVPADTSGQGFYISIVTSVYTNSDYTTKNQNYGDEETTYLVQDRVMNVGRGGGGLDSRTVRRIVEEVIDAKLPKEEASKKNTAGSKLVEAKKLTEPARWDEVLIAIGKLQDFIQKQDKPEKLDYKPFNQGIESILSAVNEKEVTEPTDISPILEKLEEKDESDSLSQEEMKEMLLDLETKFIATIKSEINEAISTTQFVSQFATFASPKKKQKADEQEEEEKPIPFNLKDLTA